MEINEVPEIAVLLPIKNGEKYIFRKIKSLREQDYERFRVFISVNLSSDNSLQLIQELTKDDKRFIVYEQKTDLTIAENISFLVKKVQMKIVLLTAVDDFMSKNFLVQAIELWASSPNMVAVVASANFDPPIHGSLRIQFDLSCSKSTRLRNLFDNIRVSHAIFYCLTTRDHLTNFIERYPVEFVGRDWIFAIFTCLHGPILSTPNSEIVFSVNGASRQRDYLIQSANSVIEKVFPYITMVKEIIRMARREDLRTKCHLYFFSVKLILGNLRRFIRNLLN